MISKYCENKVKYDLMNDFKRLEEEAKHLRIYNKIYQIQFDNPLRGQTQDEMEKSRIDLHTTYLNWFLDCLPDLMNRGPIKRSLFEILDYVLTHETVNEAQRLHKLILKDQNGEFFLNHTFEDEWNLFQRKLGDFCYEKKMNNREYKKIKDRLSMLSIYVSDKNKLDNVEFSNKFDALSSS